MPERWEKFLFPNPALLNLKSVAVLSMKFESIAVGIAATHCFQKAVWEKTNKLPLSQIVGNSFKPSVVQDFYKNLRTKQEI